ncbi:MAG: GDSL-type esterase/lipase family protein [Candidatus Aminicenantales bacterium]
MGTKSAGRRKTLRFQTLPLILLMFAPFGVRARERDGRPQPAALIDAFAATPLKPAGTALKTADGPGPIRLKSGDRIVTLGDSITEAGGYQAFVRAVLDRFYPDLKVDIINAGVSGNKAPDMRERLQRDVIDRKPTVVTISCGINDVWHSFSFTPSRGVDLETYARLMGEMVRAVKSSTRAEIYLLTPTVIYENLRSPENLQLESYVQAVRDLARRERVHLVDLNDLFNLTLQAAQSGGAPDFHPTLDGVHMKPSGDFLIGASILRAFNVPMSRILEAAEPTAPAVAADDPRIQYWGRWDLRNASSRGAVTVNTGSTIVVRFEGSNLTLHFSVAHYTHGFPTLWLQVDEGDWRVVRPAEAMAISPADLPSGPHLLRLVVKGFREWENRWEAPLVGSIVFRGLTPAKNAALLPAPARPPALIEYLGDSITEGVLVSASGDPELWTRENWPQYGDGRCTWAYQSALRVGAEPRLAGFGRLGLTISGNGGVPPAIHSFPFIYAGAPIDALPRPDVVVINMGTNDAGAPYDVFLPLYRQYLRVVRGAYPGARILCLRPFNGAQEAAIRSAAEQSGDERIQYVDTTGWIQPEKHYSAAGGVHPNLEGNAAAGEKLAAILGEILKK